MKNLPWVGRLSVVLLSLALTGMLPACGGGGGGGGGAPVAKSGLLTTAEDTPANSTLVATDPDGGTLNYIIVTNPMKGTVTVTDAVSGSYTYTPNLNETGADSFQFKAGNGTELSEAATISVTITPVNDPPAANDGTLAVTEDTPKGGLFSASDPESDSLTYQIVTNGTLGTAVITNAATGAYTYTPNLNASGGDSLQFKVNDGTDDSNVATVTVTIAAVNDPPAAIDDSAGVTEDDLSNQASGDLRANDSDPDDALANLSIVSVGGSTTPGTVSGTYGSLQWASDGTFTYTLDNSDPDTDALAAGASAIDAFSYIIEDPMGLSGSATLNITVTGANDAPVVTGQCGTTRQESALTGQLQASDVDSAGLSYSLVTDGTKGTVAIIGATGEFTYTPYADPGLVPGRRPRGTDTFTFEVDDGDGGITQGTQTVIIDQRVMPLGDSITSGYITGANNDPTVRVGYRKALYDALVADGYSVDFVGTCQHGTNYVAGGFDPDNEGHGGWSAADLIDGTGPTGAPGCPDPATSNPLAEYLDANPPDVVLLHIGTNEFATTQATDIENILIGIQTWENGSTGNPVTVLLARIVDQYPWGGTVTTFNNNVESIANTRIGSGDLIDVVDLERGAGLIYPGAGSVDVTGTDMSNALHPTQVGYDKMAALWKTHLVGALDAPCGP